jgi:hypothetical protein
MSLRQLRLANFKAISGPVDIEFGRRTFLYGLNPAVKSAVLDALDLLVALGRGDLQDAQPVSQLQHADSDGQGIRLGATVYIDGLLLPTRGKSRLMELGKLNGVRAVAPQ